MQRLIVIVGGVVIGVVMVLVVAALLGDNGDGGDDPQNPEFSFPAIDHDPEAADALLEVWARWRGASFVTVGQWSRVLDGDETGLEGPTYLAQDPPRRISVRLGSVIEEIDETIARCDLPSEELIVPDCLAAETSRSYDERVADELAVVEEYVLGEERLYDVGFGELDGCYRVELEVPLLRVSWGRWSEFCFDPEIGALLSSRTRRQSAVDREVTLEVRTDVTDLDFDVAQ